MELTGLAETAAAIIMALKARIIVLACWAYCVVSLSVVVAVDVRLTRCRRRITF